jgi:hypothetical protein
MIGANVGPFPELTAAVVAGGNGQADQRHQTGMAESAPGVPVLRWMGDLGGLTRATCTIYSVVHTGGSIVLAKPRVFSKERYERWSLRSKDSEDRCVDRLKLDP